MILRNILSQFFIVKCFSKSLLVRDTLLTLIYFDLVSMFSAKLNVLSTLHCFLTLETMKYSYLIYFSRQKIGLSSTKVKISCLRKNSPYLIFIIVLYRLQKFLPVLFLSLTHFAIKTTSAIFRYECKQINNCSSLNVHDKA